MGAGMGSRLSRILAMVCSTAVLVCVAAWLIAGAPNVPHINILTDPAADAYFRNGDESLSWMLIWGLASAWPLAAHLVLMMLALSVAMAAALSLVILTRSERKGTVTDLGVGLGFWSLSICYLGLFSIVTTFAFFSSMPVGARMACDTVAMLLLFAASQAVVRFWMGFPRPVTESELAGFIGKSRVAKPMRQGMRALGTGLAVICVVWMGLIWRGVLYLPAFPAGLLDVLSQLLSIGLSLGFIGVLGWPVLKCLRLLRFHRALGSAEDRARIEWIWSALWIALILCLLPVVVAPAMALGERWFPELAFDLGWVGIYLILALLTAPLIVIVALALSVFYRGAVDPRLALRGFTVWTLLGIVLTLIFVFIERTVALRLVGWWHLPPQTGYVTAGAIVAATFQPIRKRMEKWVNRFVERVLPRNTEMDAPVEVIKLDISHASTPQSLHEMLAAAFQFPSYYGRNWDAFWDCIRDPEQSRMPKHVVLIGFEELEKKLPALAKQLRKSLSDNQKDYPGKFTVSYVKRELP